MDFEVPESYLFNGKVWQMLQESTGMRVPGLEQLVPVRSVLPWRRTNNYLRRPNGALHILYPSYSLYEISFVLFCFVFKSWYDYRANISPSVHLIS